MPVVPNLVLLQGYDVTTVPGLVRAIKDVYTRVAVAESVEAPLLQFGRRYVEQINAPNRIVIVARKGPWGGLLEMGAAQIAEIRLLIEVHIWGAEPAQTDDELENELARFDEADPMVVRFMSVLNRVAVGRIEPLDLDPDAGRKDPASVNEYGETYVLTFRFIQGVARDGVVFSVLPDLDGDGKPTPQLSPPPIYSQAPADSVDLTVTTTPE